jgi:hypothetical protein
LKRYHRKVISGLAPPSYTTYSEIDAICNIYIQNTIVTNVIMNCNMTITLL